MSRAPRGWARVVRIGLVQAAIGSVVVLMTSTLNRVLVVELGLPAAVPGGLVALHFLVQLALRPRLGFGSDRSARRTPWILGGMVLLALSGTAASASTLLIASNRAIGLIAATAAFVVLGGGVSAAGTSLLALLAELIPGEARARAAATVWLMMIAGFVVTTIATSFLLEPFSLLRLVVATGVVGALAVGVAVAALHRLEPGREAAPPVPEEPAIRFRQALRQAGADPATRFFVVFILVSMLAYSAQDLILEPFAARGFSLTPAETTRISGLHQGGMLLGMILTGAFAVRWGSLRAWATGGCALSALGLVALTLTPATGSVALLRAALLGLGVGNGCFAIGAVGSMMALAVAPGSRSAGIRMGVFGGAQAVAYAAGGFAGAAGSDLAGYGTVFLVEAALFAVAAVLALRTGRAPSPRQVMTRADAGDHLMATLA